MTEMEANGPCKGIVFRGYTNRYYDGYKVVFNQELRVLRRKSCTGCEQCGWIYEELTEMENDDNLAVYSAGKEGRLKSGALYSVRPVDICHDPETGLIDDYALEFYEIKEDI